jgi:hypothetical protein
MQLSAARGIPFTLQSAATTGNGNVVAIPNTFNRHKVTIKWSAGVSAGAVQIEGSDDPSFSGTWNPVGGGPIATTAANSIQSHEWEGIFLFVRSRITTNVVGGTVTVTYEGS